MITKLRRKTFNQQEEENNHGRKQVKKPGLLNAGASIGVGVGAGYLVGRDIKKKANKKVNDLIAKSDAKFAEKAAIIRKNAGYDLEGIRNRSEELLNRQDQQGRSFRNLFGLRKNKNNKSLHQSAKRTLSEVKDLQNKLLKLESQDQTRKKAIEVLKNRANKNTGRAMKSLMVAGGALGAARYIAKRSAAKRREREQQEVE